MVLGGKLVQVLYCSMPGLNLFYSHGFILQLFPCLYFPPAAFPLLSTSRPLINEVKQVERSLTFVTRTIRHAQLFVVGN